MASVLSLSRMQERALELTAASVCSMGHLTARDYAHGASALKLPSAQT